MYIAYSYQILGFYFNCFRLTCRTRVQIQFWAEPISHCLHVTLVLLWVRPLCVCTGDATDIAYRSSTTHLAVAESLTFAVRVDRSLQARTQHETDSSRHCCARCAWLGLMFCLAETIWKRWSKLLRVSLKMIKHDQNGCFHRRFGTLSSVPTCSNCVEFTSQAKGQI